MDIDQKAAIYCQEQTEISQRQVLSVLVMLYQEDCTVPFITRYRKEKTGGLDETQIRLIQEKYEEYLEREKRREYILEAIKKLEKLTPELEKKIKACETLNQLEDLYAPYKSKRKTKGMKAKEQGLEPFSEIILNTKEPMEEIAKKAAAFISEEKGVKSFDDVIKGACDIIIENFAHDTEIKEELRTLYWSEATIKSSKKKDAETIKDFHKFKDYFEFEQKVSELKNPKVAHRFLAIKRGLAAKVLKVDIIFDEDIALHNIEAKHFSESGLTLVKVLRDCAKKAYKNYIHSSLDLEIKTELKKESDVSAIEVFKTNLKNLLLQPYLGPKTVLGIDPGVVTGCKVVVVDDSGQLVIDTVIYPHPPKNFKEQSAQILSAIIEKFKVEYVAIGNGTFGRETLEFVEELVPEVRDGNVKATMISEDGASIYSASEIAQKEFPDKDATVRGAISIARRFQDPLAELVKIDPKSIGVGQYQHDVNQVKLKRSLDGVVESCVNFVGVDINTASAPLLSFVSGIGPSVAGNIVKHRDKNGLFSSRDELLKVSRLTNKVFEQSAGFLRIYNGKNPLDATFIHPERYEILEGWAKKHQKDLKDLVTNKELAKELKSDKTLKEEIGQMTLEDIHKSLTAPSQDPRTEFKSTEFRKDVKDIKDLKIGDWYPGIVKNITQFGAFVDIGIKESGLLHISQIADKFVENPLEVLKVGEEVSVKVMDVDIERKRISLTRKSGEDHRQVDRGYDSNKKPKRNNHSQTPPPKANNPFAKALKNFKL